MIGGSKVEGTPGSLCLQGPNPTLSHKKSINGNDSCGGGTGIKFAFRPRGFKLYVSPLKDAWHAMVKTLKILLFL